MQKKDSKIKNKIIPKTAIVDDLNKSSIEQKEVKVEIPKTSIEDDLKKGNIQFMAQSSSSDLIRAMECLDSPDNLESNTILTNEQVNALSLMNWASQIYKIQFFTHYVALFPKYRISGDDGRGRKEKIQIAEAIRRDKEIEHNRIMEVLQRK